MAAFEVAGTNALDENMSPLHVMPLIYFYEADLRTPEALLDRYATIRPFARALHDEGASVTVLQRFHTDLDFWEDGVHFRFCADACDPSLGKWQIPRSFHASIRAVCESAHAPKPIPTAIHLNGLLYPLQSRALRKMIPTSCSIVLQHHAGGLWPGLIRPLQRWGLQSADGFFFAARDLANPWIDQGLISKRQSIYQIMEGSTNFQPHDREPARARTGMIGNPVVLWVGRLIPLKDPLTVLEGFERILQQAPKGKLYMAYGTSDMLPAVKDRLATSKKLAEAVTLLGRVDHSKLEDIYNSSDYFVLGSHHEGSGFSLAEAMACGVVPVVTNIPSFRAMTDNGRIGACWHPGNARDFAEEFLYVMRQPVAQLSINTSAFFQAHLSYQAIARDSIRAYREVIRTRQNYT